MTCSNSPCSVSRMSSSPHGNRRRVLRINWRPVEEDQQHQMDDQIPVARPLTDYDVIIEALPPGTMSNLHEIAKRMVAVGFGKECCHVYTGCRREFLKESMSMLGLQKLSIEEAQSMKMLNQFKSLSRSASGTTKSVSFSQRPSSD